MRVEKVSAVAEIVSSVAIVATLVYLSVQTQQNTQALQVNARQAAADAEIQFLYQFLESSAAADILDTFPYDELEDEYEPQGVRSFSLLATALFRLRENLWLQHESGALDPELWMPYRDLLVEFLVGQEIALIQWRANEAFFAPGFVDEINRLLALRLSRDRSESD